MTATRSPAAFASGRSRSISLVLPEPTGPPIPILTASRSAAMAT